MAKKKKRHSSFRGKARTNSSRRKHGNKYKHLSIPAGTDIFMPEKDTKYLFDILLYEVTDKHHPDRDETEEIAVEDTLWYKRPYKVHNGVGANNEKVICPHSVGKACPICDYQKEMRDSGDGDDDTIKKLYPSDRNLYVVVPLNSKKYEAKPHIFDFSDFMFQEKFEEQLGEDEGFDYFADLEEGLSLHVRFGESSFSPGFPDPVRFDFEKRKEQYDEDILDEVPKLDECLNILPYEVIKAKFFEVDIDEEEEEEEEEERPRGYGKRSSGKRKPKPEPDDEEEEEEEEGYDDEEEEEEEPEVSLEDEIEDCETVKELLALAKDYPAVFKAHMRELRKLKTTKKLKAGMLALVEESEEDDLPFSEEEEEAPRKKRTKKSEKECPEGFEFGVDTDEYDECEECPIWDACYAKQQGE